MTAFLLLLLVVAATVALMCYAAWLGEEAEADAAGRDAAVDTVVQIPTQQDRRHL